MTRIRESATPVRARTLQETRPTVEAKPAKVAEAVRQNRLSGLSGFKDVFGGAPTTPSPQGFGTLPNGEPKLSANDLGVIPQDQGNTNACGTTSLANVMTHWGMPRNHDQIDDKIRAFEMFTAPDKLVEYARDNGMRAELKADANLNDIASMIDQGAPPIVLIDPNGDGSDAGLHYVTVTGYERDAQGNISNVVIADSAGGNRYSLSAEEFQRRWDNLQLGGVSTGLNNVMITAVPNDGRNVVGGDGQTRNVNDIQLPKSSFWSNIKSGFARGVANLLSNVTNTAENVWNGIKSVGSWVSNAASTVGNAVSSAASAVGNAVSSAANTVVDGAKKLWKSIFG